MQIKTSKVEMLVVDITSGDTYSHIQAIGWKHLGKATELTEEDWMGIVDSESISDLDGVERVWYKNYEYYFGEYTLNTTTESGLSLLKANNIELTEQTHIFIKEL